MSQTKAQLLDPVDLTIVTADLADDAVTTDKLASNAVVNASVDASAAIAGTKISPDFGSQNIATTGHLSAKDIFLSDPDPTIFFTDNNNNPNYIVQVNSGIWKVNDSTNSVDRLRINSDGHVDVTGNLDVGAGLDVTGNVTATGSITITSAAPNLLFTESDDNPDFGVLLSAGQLKFQDVTNTANILTLDSNKIQAVTNLDALAGIDVTGNIVGTADLTVNTNTLKVDSSNGRVGIGTASPEEILHVHESSNSPCDFRISNNEGYGFLRSDSNLLAYNAQLHLFANRDRSTEYMRLDTSGRLGLGVTSISDARFRIKGANNSTSTFNDGLMVTSNNETVYKKYSWAGIEVKGGLTFNEANSGSVVETMRIDSSGNVGIGETSPSTILHVKASNPDVYLENTGGGTGQLRIGHFTNSAFIGTYNDDGGNSDALRFGTHSGDERMRITSDGKVGIGTSNPNQNLMVMDTIANEPQIRIETSDGGSKRLDLFVDSSSNATISAQQSASDINIKARNNTVFMTGGVGAEVETMRIKSDNDVLLTRATAGGGGNETLLISANYGSGGDQALQASNSLRFYTNGTNERIRINTSGIVGIGTTAPEGKGLDVTVNRTNNYAEATDTRNLANIICRNSSDAAGRFAALSFINGGSTQAEGSINLVQTGNYNGDLAFKLRTAVSTWAERMRIKSDGRVFIGNSNPAAAANADDLCIGDNDSSNESGITLGSNTASGIRFADGDNNSAGVLEYQHNNDRFAFAPGGNVHLKIDSDGIKFNADTAAANALDDYEEGTWTPITSGFVNAGTNDNATYVKIGQLVHIGLNIFQNNNNMEVSVGDYITGLPFPIKHLMGVFIGGYNNKDISGSYLVTDGNGNRIVFQGGETGIRHLWTTFIYRTTS